MCKRVEVWDWWWVLGIVEWDNYLLLVWLTYNNNFHSSIRIVLFEALYGRRCMTPLYWYDSGESVVLDLRLFSRLLIRSR